MPSLTKYPRSFLSSSVLLTASLLSPSVLAIENTSCTARNSEAVLSLQVITPLQSATRKLLHGISSLIPMLDIQDTFPPSYCRSLEIPENRIHTSVQVNRVLQLQLSQGGEFRDQAGNKVDISYISPLEPTRFFSTYSGVKKGILIIKAHENCNGGLQGWEVLGRVGDDVSFDAKLEVYDDPLQTNPFEESLYRIRAAGFSTSTPERWEDVDSSVLFVLGENSFLEQEDVNYLTEAEEKRLQAIIRGTLAQSSLRNENFLPEEEREKLRLQLENLYRQVSQREAPMEFLLDYLIELVEKNYIGGEWLNFVSDSEHVKKAEGIQAFAMVFDHVATLKRILVLREYVASLPYSSGGVSGKDSFARLTYRIKLSSDQEFYLVDFEKRMAGERDRSIAEAQLLAERDKERMIKKADYVYNERMRTEKLRLRLITLSAQLAFLSADQLKDIEQEGPKEEILLAIQQAVEMIPEEDRILLESVLIEDDRGLEAFLFAYSYHEARLLPVSSHTEHAFSPFALSAGTMRNIEVNPFDNVSAAYGVLRIAARYLRIISYQLSQHLETNIDPEFLPVKVLLNALNGGPGEVIAAINKAYSIQDTTLSKEDRLQEAFKTYEQFLSFPEQKDYVRKFNRDWKEVKLLIDEGIKTLSGV